MDTAYVTEPNSLVNSVQLIIPLRTETGRRIGCFSGRKRTAVYNHFDS